MKWNHWLIKLLLFTIWVPLPSLADSNYSFLPEKGKVSFLAKGKPALISIRGEGTGPQGTLQEKNSQLSGDLIFDLTSLKTGIELRDDHLKNKYLEVEKHPKAKLSITDLQLPENRSGKISFTGELEIRAVRQKVEGSVSLIPSGNLTEVEAEFTIQLSRFQIPIPGYQGITVAEEVRIQVKSQVSRQDNSK